jgi:tRNA dimethylallyltransferase
LHSNSKLPTKGWSSFGRNNQKSKITDKISYDALMMIGLSSPRSFINSRIKERVKERIRDGFEKELKSLLARGLDWEHQSMQSTGYRQSEEYQRGKISWKEFVGKWTAEEQKYARRQVTWFKKDRRINWFDISQPDCINKVEMFVESWYHR